MVGLADTHEEFLKTGGDKDTRRNMFGLEFRIFVWGLEPRV